MIFRFYNQKFSPSALAMHLAFFPILLVIIKLQKEYATHERLGYLRAKMIERVPH